MSLVAGVRTLTSTPSRAVAISDWVRIGRERKYGSVTQRRSCTPAVRNSSIRNVRILRGSWTTRRGHLPRRLDILRVRALVVGQLLHQLAPQLGEGVVDVGHDGAPHADGGVPVGQPRLLGADHPPVGDAHAARRGVLAVHDEQLAVVAPNNT